MRTADGRSHTIRNVIWDVDGTLFDTYPAIARAYRAALNDLGQDAPLRRIADLARESLSTCASTLAKDYRVDLTRLETAAADHYERTSADEQPPFPGVREVCDCICRAGGQNVIVTHRGSKGTAELLSANGLSRFFSGTITHADGYARKPDPSAFNAIIERHGLRRDETLAIGDRAIDVAAGRAAGVLTCFFGPVDPAIDADLTISDFGELARILAAPDE